MVCNFFLYTRISGNLPEGKSGRYRPASPAQTLCLCRAHSSAGPPQSPGDLSASVPVGSPAGTSDRSTQHNNSFLLLSELNMFLNVQWTAERNCVARLFKLYVCASTCRQWTLIIELLPVTDSLATFFITSSISGTRSFLDRIAWRTH